MTESEICNRTPTLVSSEMLLGSREAAQELGIYIDDTLREYQIDPTLPVTK